MTIEHEIRIAAPPEVVWQVTLDVERWPEWTPTVTTITRLDASPLRIGSRVRIEQPAQPPAVWTVTVVDGWRRFAWETRRPGLHMVAIHDLVPRGAGTTNVLRLEAHGWLATVFGPFLRLPLRRALARENRGLRARSEAITASSPTAAV